MIRAGAVIMARALRKLALWVAMATVATVAFVGAAVLISLIIR